MRFVTLLCALILMVPLATNAVDCKTSPGASYSYPVCTASNGSITMVPSNGTAPYTYRWSDNETTSAISHLAPGSYTVTITDANACTVSRTFTLTPVYKTPNLTTTIAGDTCSMARGKITVNVVSNATAPYQYLWSNNATTATASSLTAGGYSVSVTDYTGCTATASATITNTGTAIIISGNVQQPQCPAAGGTITVSASGGTSNTYHYAWANGSTSNSVYMQTGNYTVTVSGTNGCSAASTYTVNTPPAAITFGGNITQPICVGKTGGISITPGGGTGPNYTAHWSNGSTANSVTGLNPGSYTVTVTDQNSCTASQSYTLNSGYAINPAATTTAPICTAANGTITMAPTVGAAPYTYSWSTGSTAAAVSGIGTSAVTVTVTDANTCTTTRTFQLSATFTRISASAAAVGDTCSANIGKVTATVSGGTAPFRYTWSNTGSTATITGLGAHYYTVVVTDTNGCSATAGASVSNLGTAITINGQATQPLCYNGTGSITINPAGGAGGGYSIVWSNGASTNTSGAVVAGSYTVTVNGSHGCSSRQIFTISNPDSIKMNYVAAPVKCDSAKGGTITLNSISNAVYPYTITWSGPGGYTSTSLSINHLNTGSYSYTLTDAHGCQKTQTFTIGTSGVLNETYAITNTSCHGASNGVVMRTSVNPYSSPAFSWTGPNGFVSDSPSIKRVPAGVYTVTVTEGYGCVGVSVDTVKDGPSISAQYSMKPVKCDSAMGGALTNTSITGATYPWAASWTGPYGFTSSSVSLSRIGGGVYTLHLTDALGCTATQNFTVDSSGAVSVTYNTADVHCAGANTGSITYVRLVPYSRYAHYSWNGPSGYADTMQSIAGLAPGNYGLVVTEDFGCHAIASYRINQYFDVGVASIKYVNQPAPGMNFVIHPIAGDMSQQNGNHCAAGISGTVQVVITGAAHYLGVTANGLQPDTVNGNTFTWNIANYGTERIDSSFFLLFKTDTNAVPGGNICVSVSVTPLNGDYNPANNTSNMCLSIIRPYDPNTKHVFPEGDIYPSQKLLTYTILFENTGNAVAHNVYLLDTLDRSADPASFKILASSNPVDMQQNGNALRFNFNNINLPDTATDYAASRGWVQYSVTLNDNLPVGTEVNNTAYIYFDYNQPIVTNTTTNRIIAPGTTYLVNNTGSFTMFPNPARSVVNISTNNDAVGGHIEIMDAIGRKCLLQSITETQNSVSTLGLARGVYLVTVIKPGGSTDTQKLIVE